MSEGFVDRLKHLIGSSSARSFANKAGIGDSTLRSILNGSKPTLDVLVAIAAAGDVSIDWLATGKSAPSSAMPPVSNLDIRKIPIHSVQSSAGGGMLNGMESVEDYIELPANYIKDHLGITPKDIHGVHVKGDSMEPTLANGDIALVDKSEADKDHHADGVYVFRYGEELFVKRLQFEGQRIAVVSDNSAYRPWSIEREDLEATAIIARVAGVIRRT